jgi:hypothetical protein
MIYQQCSQLKFRCRSDISVMALKCMIIRFRRALNLFRRHSLKVCEKNGGVAKSLFVFRFHSSNEWSMAASIIVLMMEAIRNSETSVNFYRTTRRYNSEDSHLRTSPHKNLKSHIYFLDCNWFNILTNGIRILLISTDWIHFDVSWCVGGRIVTFGKPSGKNTCLFRRCLF